MIATDMRPKKIEDFIGQRHFLYDGSLLYNSIKRGNFESAIFFGPPGTGKTTLARIICNELDAKYVEVNGASTSLKEFKEILELAYKRKFGLEQRQTIVYVDEIHRWNKLQQDSLLKAMEEGYIKVIATTTENPFFSINNAVLSRIANIYEFKPLTEEDIVIALKRTLSDAENGLGSMNISYDEEALLLLARLSNGDCRNALQSLEFIAANLNAKNHISKEHVLEAKQKKSLRYDKGDDKYNLLSALQKSIRGSDPDASILYLAELIEGGQDLSVICRRLLVIASEDISMAYPSAVSIVKSCVDSALFVGLPEARIPLSQAVILLASSPKSNATYMAYEMAANDIRNSDVGAIPDHLKDSHYQGSKRLGAGEGYLYPHSFGGYVEQQYLPDKLYEQGRTYYDPTENGSEKNFKRYLEELKKHANH